MLTTKCIFGIFCFKASILPCDLFGINVSKCGGNSCFNINVNFNFDTISVYKLSFNYDVYIGSV